MNKNKFLSYYLYVTITALLLCQFSIAQQKFAVTLQIPTQLDEKKVMVSYDNGKQQVDLKNPVFKNHKIFVSAPYFAHYAALIVGYPIEGTKSNWNVNKFFIKDKAATIIIQKPDSLQKPFDNYKLINAFDFKKEINLLNNYAAAEQKASDDYYLLKTDEVNISHDTVIYNKMNELSLKAMEKQYQFICNNHDSYFYFWFYRRYLYRSGFRPADTLLRTFNTIFTDDLKFSAEGNMIRKYFLDKMAMQQNRSPNFVCEDIKGNTISLANYLNKKFVLVTFWSTSCGPCLAEMPAIRSIWLNRNPDTLEVISVSTDTNYDRFAKVIKEKQMDWVNIFNKIEPIYAFNVNPIPAVYLIDMQGNIVYNRIRDGDAELPRVLEANHLLKSL